MVRSFTIQTVGNTAILATYSTLKVMCRMACSTRCTVRLALSFELFKFEACMLWMLVKQWNPNFIFLYSLMCTKTLY